MGGKGQTWGVRRGSRVDEANEVPAGPALAIPVPHPEPDCGPVLFSEYSMYVIFALPSRWPPKHLYLHCFFVGVLCKLSSEVNEVYYVPGPVLCGEGIQQSNLTPASGKVTVLWAAEQ